MTLESEPTPARDLPDTLLRAAVLGGVAGLRTVMPLAVLSTHLGGTRSEATSRGWLIDLLAKPWTARGLQLAELGELIGDKLPVAGSRLMPAPLAMRVFAGATSGGIQSLIDGHAAQLSIGPVCTAVGAVGAVAGAMAGYWLRTTIPRVLPVPPLLLALAEDALAFILARWAAR